ncbi:MAG: DNA integrity scanning protein DisA [Thermoleophilia bacterium]|nr:DNA integrity scanning protein DisA [Thermoleophilia bacterium]
MVDSGSDLRLDKRLVEALYLVAPGTPLREGIDSIIRAKTGALIVLGDEESISFLFSGGIRLETDFTPNLLYEVSKMDGATILNRNVTRIHWTNVQLMPDASLESMETGTRHRTAERVAKQTDALCISISQDRDQVSLYIDELKYMLTDIRLLISEANQALSTLERYRSRLDQVTDNLTALEFEDAVTLYDVTGVIQRGEMVARVAGEVEMYLIEMGVSGRLIAMQLEELMTGVARDRAALIKDYMPARGRGVKEVEARISRMTADELFDTETVARALGYRRKAKATDIRLSPRGYRVLANIPRLPVPVVETIVETLGTLKAVMMADEDDLVEIAGVGRVRAREIAEGLMQMKELSLAEKYSLR